MKLFIVLSGSSLDRKIDFSQHNVLLPSYYFFSKRTKKFSINAFVPKCKEWFLDSGGFSLLSKWKDVQAHENFKCKKTHNEAARIFAKVCRCESSLFRHQDFFLRRFNNF